MVTDNKCAKKVLFLEFQVLYNAIGYHIYIQMYRDMILHSYKKRDILIFDLS